MMIIVKRMISEHFRLSLFHGVSGLSSLQSDGWRRLTNDGKRVEESLQGRSDTETKKNLFNLNEEGAQSKDNA